MLKHLPNALTLLNLFCGAIAVIFAVQNQFAAAALFVFLGIFFDFFDGFAARLLKVQSELGLQLDSLADMVTSGLVPGIVMFKLLALTTNTDGHSIDDSWNTMLDFQHLDYSLVPLIGLLITLASAYRLAKFNIDDEQQTYFKGLPTPANTLMIVSLPVILEFQNTELISRIILNPWFLIGLTLLSCYLLNSHIKLFALKFKTWDFKPNAMRYSFIALSLVLVMVLQFVAIPLVILLYISLSLVDTYVLRSEN
ncbi:CDP-diacylglycerol--serine O-phosphatidyltransferase [Flavobacteriaceae bacterium MAR_2010_105]|nr:CDP-diacylglycerol--serine O-phosphatidyltransferase [Flavobacteriaceae bacterium MAR_2010_105]